MTRFMDLIKDRFSVRSFSDQKVEEEKLDLILEAAKLAPTAKNNQPWRIYLLQSEEALKKINSVCDCIFGSSAVFVICYDIDEAWHSPFDEGNHAGEMGASIVCTHMMLAAWELGIGSCWVKRFKFSDISNLLELPSHIRPACILPVGYAAADARPSIKHESYRDLKELVIRL